MNENEQIKEIARTICGLNTDKGCFCDGGYCNYNCLAYEKAKTLYAKGYRKASEVAREIFEEIETVLSTFAYPTMTALGTIETKRADGFHIRFEDYYTIKKKYTEGEK